MNFKFNIHSFIARRKSILPKSLRFAAFRRQLTLPHIQGNDLVFKPAETKEEFLAACRILHDSYVECKYMEPEISGLRVTPYHLLPSTVTLIVKKGSDVIGTVSIVRDNPLGLPMDKIFDLSHLRRANRRIGEISALAIQKEYRGKKGAVLHLVMRYLWKFTQEHLNLDTFVCAVNPAMNELWESVYFFKPLKPANRVGVYDFVNGAPAVGLVVPVSGNFAIWESFYKTRPLSGNLHRFIQEPFNANEFNFSNPYYSIFLNPMNAETREQFLTDPSIKLLSRLSMEDQTKIFCLLNNEKFMEFDYQKHLISLKDRNERYEVFCHLLGKQDSTILDVSKTGLKLAPNNWITDCAPDFLSLQLGPNRTCRVKTKLKWRNNHGASGHEIIDADESWNDFISFLRCDSKINLMKKCG